MTTFSDTQFIPPASSHPADSEGECQEMSRWIGFARAGRALPAAKREHVGSLMCRLPFNLATQDRFGQQQVQMVRSHSLSDRDVVLFSRHKLQLYREVRIQLDDGTDRAWVRARVTQNTSTVGGHLVRLEYISSAATDA
jgi:hypothetical protein